MSKRLSVCRRRPVNVRVVLAVLVLKIAIFAHSIGQVHGMFRDFRHHTFLTSTAETPVQTPDAVAAEVDDNATIATMIGDHSGDSVVDNDDESIVHDPARVKSVTAAISSSTKADGIQLVSRTSRLNRVPRSTSSYTQLMEKNGPMKAVANPEPPLCIDENDNCFELLNSGPIIRDQTSTIDRIYPAGVLQRTSENAEQPVVEFPSRSICHHLFTSVCRPVRAATDADRSDTRMTSKDDRRRAISWVSRLPTDPSVELSNGGHDLSTTVGQQRMSSAADDNKRPSVVLAKTSVEPLTAWVKDRANEPPKLSSMELWRRGVRLCLELATARLECVRNFAELYQTIRHQMRGQLKDMNSDVENQLRMLPLQQLLVSMVQLEEEQKRRRRSGGNEKKQTDDRSAVASLNVCGKKRDRRLSSVFHGPIQREHTQQAAATGCGNVQSDTLIVDETHMITTDSSDVERHRNSGVKLLDMNSDVAVNDSSSSGMSAEKDADEVDELFYKRLPSVVKTVDNVTGNKSPPGAIFIKRLLTSESSAASAANTGSASAGGGNLEVCLAATKEKKRCYDRYLKNFARLVANSGNKFVGR